MFFIEAVEEVRQHGADLCASGLKGETHTTKMQVSSTHLYAATWSLRTQRFAAQASTHTLQMLFLVIILLVGNTKTN